MRGRGTIGGDGNLRAPVKNQGEAHLPCMPRTIGVLRSFAINVGIPPARNPAFMLYLGTATKDYQLRRRLPRILSRVPRFTNTCTAERQFAGETGRTPLGSPVDCLTCGCGVRSSEAGS